MTKEQQTKADELIEQLKHDNVDYALGYLARYTDIDVVEFIEYYIEKMRAEQEKNQGLGPDGKAGVLHTSIEKVRFLQDPPGVKMKQFLAIFTLIFLIGCSESEPAKPQKFRIGAIVQLKIDGSKGQIITYWKHDRSYMVRLSRYGEYKKMNLEEFELEKWDGERR